ncbi:hypothetical protein FRE64_02995 [Euhalothece natronophila Z-M001]|uniref:Uncharacterized protein n=1 Tax=Euhalothece natronophila Z-M001 TaxID=522448 RepID=A0A5B8NJ41_9CHRO|nr:hypothetical protein [Euhalothece natronophila]QDZ38994.1 hypothetical protein FRE64_02995 [Euhalothece natronophila Z-M001]
MNQPNTDWEKRLQELEAEVNESSQQQQTSSQKTNFSAPSPLNMGSQDFSQQMQGIKGQVQRWFQGLPLIGKVIVVAIGIGVSLSLLKTVFQLVTSVLTLAIIGALGYVGYKVFIGDKNSSAS